MSPKEEYSAVGEDSPQAECKKYLHGISYPASKEDLVEAVRDGGAPKEVINLIENLPDTDYCGPHEVLLAYAARNSRRA